ncbi:hypothetical protein [Stenotrophomonas sp.]|uniref:hypothetical protein n=1 Tax=Stenotrophomonas sp. TaxID=69392 RepID=UPI002FC7F891
MRWPFTRAPAAPTDGPGAEHLQALLSGDPQRIQGAACAIAQLHDPLELDALVPWIERIAQATAHVALGGALFSNNHHLQFALRRLRFWEQRTGCLCSLYPHYPFFDPRREAARGHVVIQGLAEAEGGWGQAHTVACATCATRWLAIDREYHYPWWEWRLAPPHPHGARPHA